MAKKLDTKKIERALHEAGRTAVTGSRASRAGQVLGGAKARTVTASGLTQDAAKKPKR